MTKPGLMKSHPRSLRIIGRAEIYAAREQVAERARVRRFRRNIAIAVGLVLLYAAVAYAIAHVGGAK